VLLLPQQLNAAENHFDYTFMGLEPGTTKADVRAAWRIGTGATTASSISPAPIGSSRAPAG